MILIDTSAWVDFFRKQGNPQAKRRVASLLNAAGAYTCPVLLELLAGARGSGEEAMVLEALSLCDRIVFQPDHWATAAGIERTLRRRGITVPRDDILVATVASEQGLTLLCHDQHFNLIAEHGNCPLRVEQVSG